MGDLSDFQRGQTVGAHLAGASVTKTTSLSRAAVSKVMTVYTNHRKTSSTERNSGRKPKLIERNRSVLKRIVSANHRNTAAKVTAESLFILKPLFPQKQSDEGFTNPTSTVEL